MSQPAQQAHEQVVPVVHELLVPHKHPVEERGMHFGATLDDAFVEDQAEDVDPFVHKLEERREGGRSLIVQQSCLPARSTVSPEGGKEGNVPPLLSSYRST